MAVLQSADATVDVTCRAVRVALFGLLLWSPLPFGAVEPPAVLAIELWACGLALATIWIVWKTPEALTGRARRLFLPWAVIAVIGVLQAFPLPADWVSALSGSTFHAREQLAGSVSELSLDLFPVSLTVPNTVDALTRFLALSIVALAAAMSLRERRHFKQAALVIVVAGVFQALYGSAEYLSGHQHIFGYAKKYYLESATGTFINRNHFAGYLAMALPFALVGLRGSPSHEIRGSWRRVVLRLATRKRLRPFIFAAASCCLVIGVLLSYSRGGLAVALVGALVIALGTVRQKHLLVGLLLVLLLPALWLSWQEVQSPGARFVTGVDEITSLNNRLPAWIAAAQLIPPSVALGTGYGTFEAAFRLHQPAAIEKHWQYLHNDWLQLLIEGGILAIAAAVFLVLLLAIPGKKPDPAQIGSRTVSAAALASLLVVCAHSTFDFSLRMPAIAVLFAFIIGMMTAVPADGSSFPPSRPHLRAAGRDR